MKKICMLMLTVLLALSSFAVCFADSAPEPNSSKHTYKTVTEPLSHSTIKVSQASVDRNNINMVKASVASVFGSKIPGFSVPGFAASQIAYTICTGLYGMNGPFKMEIRGERVTRYQTYVPTGIKTVVWTKLKYSVDYYTLKGSRYVYHHSQSVVHNL